MLYEILKSCVSDFLELFLSCDNIEGEFLDVDLILFIHLVKYCDILKERYLLCLQ